MRKKKKSKKIKIMKNVEREKELKKERTFQKLGLKEKVKMKENVKQRKAALFINVEHVMNSGKMEKIGSCAMIAYYGSTYDAQL